MDISERIINRMKEIGLSQKEFSRLSGIPESTISDWKKKGNTPKSEKLLEICGILGISIYELLGREGDFAAPDYVLTSQEKMIIESFRSADGDTRNRIMSYFEGVAESYSNNTDIAASTPIPADTDSDLLQQKLLARKLRKLARLDRIKLDESAHSSDHNLHLFKYLDYLGIDKLDYIKDYFSHIQPFMLREMRSQEKFENAVCVLDRFYRISLYIKVDATRGEEIIVSFHENHKNGIAVKNSPEPQDNMVYVFADSIGSHISGSNNYSVNLFITRGVRSFPINVPAVRYDDDGFLVRYRYINNALTDIANRYLDDLYTSDIDPSNIELFSSIQQLSFTSYGNDVFSNISLLTDSILIQKDTIGRQVADAALVIYCNSVNMIDSDKEELLSTLRSRFEVNSSRAVPQILERIEQNL